jgi:hypothetical protein
MFKTTSRHMNRGVGKQCNYAENYGLSRLEKLNREFNVIKMNTPQKALVTKVFHHGYLVKLNYGTSYTAYLPKSQVLGSPEESTYILVSCIAKWIENSVIKIVVSMIDSVPLKKVEKNLRSEYKSKRGHFKLDDIKHYLKLKLVKEKK